MEEVKQEIRQPIKVLASFAPEKLAVHFFSWRGRNYKVSSMNLFHIERDGAKKIYHVAVTAEGNCYQLAFDPVTLTWELRDVISL